MLPELRSPIIIEFFKQFFDVIRIWVSRGLAYIKIKIIVNLCRTSY